MKKNHRQNPQGYDGTRITTHAVKDLLPKVLQKIGKLSEENPSEVLGVWPEVIGPQLASMTQAVSFSSGVLTVKVKNSTLHSLLNQKDKPRILANLKEKFPHILIKNIIFRMG